MNQLDHLIRNFARNNLRDRYPEQVYALLSIAQPWLESIQYKIKSDRDVPPLRLDSILEYAHRLLAALTSLAVFATAIAGIALARKVRWLSWPPVIAVALLANFFLMPALMMTFEPFGPPREAASPEEPEGRRPE